MRIIQHQLRNVLYLILLYAACMTIFQLRWTRELASLQSDFTEVSKRHKVMQDNLLEARDSVIEESIHQEALRHYAKWRADVELIDFTAGFENGVALVERNNDNVSFIREFGVNDTDEITLTKEAVRQLLYWQFERLSVSTDKDLTRATWTFKRRADE